MTAHPKPIEPPWRIDPSIDINRVSLEDVKLIFSQAEKRLADTIRTRESIESKTMTIISLMTGVLIALCGYVISSWNPPVSDKVWAAITGAIYIMGLFIFMLQIVLTDKYNMQGSKPSKLMNPSLFTKEIKQDNITLFLYLNEIESYNLRIERNSEENSRRQRLLRLSIILLLFLPVFLGMAFATIKWLTWIGTLIRTFLVPFLPLATC